MNIKKRRVIKAQVTVFVILAIVLVVAGGIAYYNVNNSKINNDFFSGADIKPTVDNIKSSIIGCQENTIKDSLENIGIQGGYYNKPEKYLDAGPIFIPYYYYEEKLFVPNNAKVQSELSNSINDGIARCIDNIEISDFEISHKTPKTTALISKGEVKITIDLPVIIKKETNIITLEMKDLPVIEKSKLYESLEVAKVIVESHKTNPEYFCLNCVSNLTEENGLYVVALSLNNSLLYIIASNSTQDKNYYFEFLDKYSPGKAETFNVPNAPVENK